MTEPIKISTQPPSLRMARAGRHAPEREGLALLFIPLMVLVFLGGLLVGAKIDGDKPTVDDPGFVNIEGHEGEILVVREDSVEWTTEAALHKAAGQG